VFGETPNLAARVPSAADPDTVLITAATQRLVAGLFVVEDRGAAALKGIATPVGLSRVVQASSVRGRLAAATSLTPLVGRERERQTLAELWERAADGEGQVALVAGEAGIGKSRLVQELKESLAQTPHTWIESGGAAYDETTPFHVVADLLRQGFAWTAAQSTAARLDVLDQSLAVVGLQPAVAAPGTGHRAHQATALCRVIRAPPWQWQRMTGARRISSWVASCRSAAVSSISLIDRKGDSG
jgi:hypothetical protein